MALTIICVSAVLVLLATAWRQLTARQKHHSFSDSAVTAKEDCIAVPEKDFQKPLEALHDAAKVPQVEICGITGLSEMGPPLVRASKLPINDLLACEFEAQKVAVVELRLEGCSLRPFSVEAALLAAAHVIDVAAIAEVPTSSVEDLHGHPNALSIRPGNVTEGCVKLPEHLSVSAFARRLQERAARDRLAASAAKVPGLLALRSEDDMPLVVTARAAPPGAAWRLAGADGGGGAQKPSDCAGLAEEELEPPPPPLLTDLLVETEACPPDLPSPDAFLVAMPPSERHFDAAPSFSPERRGWLWCCAPEVECCEHIQPSPPSQPYIPTPCSVAPRAPARPSAGPNDNP